MILAKVRKSRKYKDLGTYSIFILSQDIFNYNALVKIRKLSHSCYDVLNRQFEIARINLNQLKNDLKDFNLVIEDEHLLLNSSEFEKELKTTAYPHQLEAICFGMNHNKFHLGDEQGLGKTKECIDIAVIKKHKFNYQHCLIICGVSTLRWNWKDEIETHSNEKCWLLGFRKNKQGKNKGKLVDKGTQKKLEDLKFIPDAYFWVINIEALRDAEIVKQLQKLCKNGTINMIVGEEIHKMKNPTCAQSKGFLKLNAETQISVSGTPLVNTPVDLFVVFKWLGIEEHTYTAFKNHYCVFGGFAGKEILGYQHLEELRAKLNKIQLRRLKKDVLTLPQKLPQTIFVEMGREQEKVYTEVLTTLQNNIDLILLNPNPLAQLTRLRQATGCPELLSSTVKESAKLDKLEELVRQIAEKGEQCLIFSNWTQMCNKIQERLYSYSTRKYTSEIPNLKAVEQEFKEDKNIVALIGTIKLMGTGLTFTNCNHVIFVDSPWTKTDKDQCIDRTHRIGQVNDVNIYTIVCANTIDEKVEKIIKKKGKLSDNIVDNISIMNSRQTLDFLLF